MKNIIVVGEGVIAETLIFHIKEKFKNQSVSLTQVSANCFYPPCSDYSTATIALRNTKKGLSPLGDLLVDGFETFKNFIESYSPMGVEKTEHHFISEKKDEKFIKRYGALGFKENSFLINWESYKKWLRSYEPTKVSRVNDFALKTEDQHLILKSNPSIAFDQLFWCTGFNRLGTLKFRPGSYLEIDYQVKKSILYELDGINIIFREIDQKLIIGSTTLKEDHYLAPVEDLKKLFSIAKTYLNKNHDIYLNNFNDFTIKTGMRSLGKRTPLIGQIGENEYGLFDFHKNGFLLSHLSARKALNFQ